MLAVPLSVGANEKTRAFVADNQSKHEQTVQRIRYDVAQPELSNDEMKDVMKAWMQDRSVWHFRDAEECKYMLQNGKQSTCPSASTPPVQRVFVPAL